MLKIVIVLIILRGITLHRVTRTPEVRCVAIAKVKKKKKNQICVIVCGATKLSKKAELGWG